MQLKEAGFFNVRTEQWRRNTYISTSFV